jgi:uncharacterized protein
MTPKIFDKFCLIYYNYSLWQYYMKLKASKYNFFYSISDGTTLAYNATSSGLAKISPDRKALVESILCSPNNELSSPWAEDIRNKLLEGRFLVDEQEDEVSRLKVANRISRFDTNYIGLTIAPTLGCNFRCPYCYETAKPGKMTAKVEKTLVKMVEQKMKTADRLSVTWFGGEPLLAQEQIGRLTGAFKRICRRNGGEYSASIVTNGYLWDRRTAQKFKRWSVGSVQITLDGPKDIHDARRPLAGKKGSFDRILNNIKETADIVPINIRVNTDKENSGRILELLDVIEQNGLKDKVGLYFARVESYTEACSNISGSCYSSREYSALEVDLCQKAMAKGFFTSRYPKTINGGYCTADSYSGLVVAPDGLLFKCWNQISAGSDQAVGHLMEKKVKPEHHHNIVKWLAWDPFEKKHCLECEILPICMGGCLYNAKLENAENKGHCSSWKYHLKDMLSLTYTGTVILRNNNKPKT